MKTAGAAMQDRPFLYPNIKFEAYGFGVCGSSNAREGQQLNLDNTYRSLFLLTSKLTVKWTKQE